MNSSIIIGIVVLILLVVASIFFIVIFPGIMANMFLSPKRQPMIKRPSDYGLAYDDVKIKTKDDVLLAGWLMRGTNNKVIIIGHPGLFSKYGYSIKHEGLMKSGYDRDVELIPTAKHLVDAGYTVLMYDQRNHGESGSTPNNKPHDLVKNVYWDNVAAAEYITNHLEFKGQDIGLMGICMNSMINAVAMSKASKEMRETNIKATTLIQPHRLDLWYEKAKIPKFIINRMNKIYRKKGVTEMKDWDAISYIKDIFVPVLFVQNVNDPTSDMDHVRENYNAIPTEKEVIWIDEKEKHRFHTYNWFNNNPEPLINFFNKHLTK